MGVSLKWFLRCKTKTENVICIQRRCLRNMRNYKEKAREEELQSASADSKGSWAVGKA